MVKRVLIDKMKSQLDSGIFNLLKDIGVPAQSFGYRSFLAGGMVRDLMLNRPLTDVDVVIEGDAPKLARHIAEKFGGSVTAESQFNTAKLSLFSTTVDFATTRNETYRNPGELPQIEMADLSEDLHRRDFSINAMAIALDSDTFGELIDPLGGEYDIVKKKIRILHLDSFQDDPTRIIRAVRYEQRLKFELECVTKESLIAHCKYLHWVSPDRLRNEFQKIFEEFQPEDILTRATGLGILDVILPGWSWPQNDYNDINASFRFNKASNSKLLISLLTASLNPGEREILIGKLNMPASWKKVVRSTNEFENQKLKLKQSSLLPSEIYAILNRFEQPALEGWFTIEKEPKIRERIRYFIDILLYKTPKLTGDDLIGLGVAPGPKIGLLLRRLHKLVLDEPEGKTTIEEDVIRDFLNRDTERN